MFQGRSVRIACLLVFALFFILGTVSAQGEHEGERAAPAAIIPEPPIIGESMSYTLGKDDVLEINVQNQPEFSGRFAVGPEGEIQYSYVGDVKVQGLTKEEVKQALIKELERFVKLPVVSVAIAEYRSKIVYILGEVGTPGKYPMVGDTLSLRDAIVEAGLPTREAAITRCYVVKSDPVKPKFTKVNLKNILYKGREKDNIDLVPGDIVVVPSTVPSEFNRALNNLLQPFSNARAADLLMHHRWGATESDEF